MFIGLHDLTTCVFCVKDHAMENTGEGSQGNITWLHPSSDPYVYTGHFIK